MVVTPFLLPLVVAAPRADRAATARSAVVLAYAVTAVVSAGLARCAIRSSTPTAGATAPSTTSSSTPTPGSRVLLEDGLAAVLARGVAAGRDVRRLALWAASRPARAATWTCSFRWRSGAAAETAHLIVLLGDPVEDPRRDAFEAIFVARAAAYIALAVGVAWTVARARSTRAAISRLAADLGETPEPGSLRAVLARTLGDHAARGRLPAARSAALRRRRGPAGRARHGGGRRRRSSATASRSRSSSTMRRSPGRASSSARSAPPRGWRSTTSGCGPGCSPSSRTCARRARGSSRRATRRAGGSNATCTTARSSACWRSPSNCGSPGRPPMPAALATAARAGRRRGAGRARRAARPRARHLSRDPHRGRARPGAGDPGRRRAAARRDQAMPQERFPEAVERAAYIVVSDAIAGAAAGTSR